MDEQQAKRFIRALDRKREKLQDDKRASACYWNGDGWDSIDGIRDAEEWLESRLARFVLQWIRRVEKKGKR